jgi:hypothetical protein
MNTTDHTRFTQPSRIDVHHHIIPPSTLRPCAVWESLILFLESIILSGTCKPPLL